MSSTLTWPYQGGSENGSIGGADSACYLTTSTKFDLIYTSSAGTDARGWLRAATGLSLKDLNPWQKRRKENHVLRCAASDEQVVQ